MSDVNPPAAIRFLTLAEVLATHARVLELYGGHDGLRNEGGLLSAVAQAEQSFGGAYLHASVYEMAAAYLFHISENQPFIDGNKRTATAAAILFLWLNDHVVIGGNEALLELVFKVASRQATKADIAAFLQRQAQPMVRPRA